MSYKHGVYGNKEETFEPTSVAIGTIPVYIGSAPVHRVNSNGSSDFKYSEYINKPILISSLREARAMGLYSDDWKTYTLCEAIHAHFMNGKKAVAPIILVNTLNPDSDVSESAGTESVTMKKMGTKFVGYITDPLCSLDDIALTISEDAGVTSKKFTYSYDGDTVVIEAEVVFESTKEKSTSFIATATYSKIEFSAEDFTEKMLEDALDCLDYCEQQIGKVPTIMVAPGISEVPQYNAILVQKAMDKLAEKWNLIVLSDIPSNTAQTYDEAKKWKADNNYDSKLCKLCWPSFGYGKKKYHGSTIGAYMMQNIDMLNNDVPYVSTSNKEIFCDRAIVGDDETLLISEIKANELNAVGITTANIINRSLRLWGAHMANYNHDTVNNIAPEDRFDASIRMSLFILNYLQNKYINEIDESFSRKDIDSIVNSIQTWLDSLVNDGMLLYARVSFNNESNSDEAIANGDFVFDLEVTYSVIAKSITFKLQYTNKGIATLTTSGGEE